MTTELKATLTDHAGNYRALMNLAHGLLSLGAATCRARTKSSSSRP